MGSYEGLYAAAPGLLISSRGALAMLETGEDHEVGHALVDEMVGAGRLVFLDTGSPQLFYVIREQSASNAPSLAASVSFGLDVSGGAIVFRDGYDLGRWNPNGRCVTLPAADGPNVVRVSWERTSDYGQMALWVAATPSVERLELQRQFNLDYEPPADD